MIMIREYRKRKGMTMKELGLRVGASESAVGLWETGKRKPSYEMLLKISEELDCSVNDLLGYYNRTAYDDHDLPEVTMVGRAASRMTPERRQDMLRLLKIAFPEEFEDE